MKFVGPPIEITPRAFAMNTALYLVISSEWHPEKFLLAEEVVHSSSSAVELSWWWGTVELASMSLSLSSPKAEGKFPKRRSVKKNISQDWEERVQTAKGIITGSSKGSTMRWAPHLVAWKQPSNYMEPVPRFVRNFHTQAYQGLTDQRRWCPRNVNTRNCTCTPWTGHTQHLLIWAKR